MACVSPVLGEESGVLEALSKAYSLPVLYARKAVVKFNSREMDSPLPRYTFSFQSGDYLHFKQPYGTTGWWVGRVVGERTWLGLLPSEEKLLAHRERVVREGQEERGEGEGEGLLVYEDAPIMRPIVFLGPSSRDAELTELLQKALVAFMKEQFPGRLHTHKPRWSVSEGLTDKQAWALRGEVYRAGHTLNLVYLDCDASYHDDISWLHPLLIYVQVSLTEYLHIHSFLQ
ncbi:Voltage-dependent L-type calcium channel subunit beta-1 [Geodia barretti]|uniref:Voltage-dependent L-type calcium channel subunit beta-1 n=1 Tax=Geodia barretti TaxID=519541 RepID=A0AA35RMX6_GEOBA|nr:Voltage-dependent L-type calcium channel subunit beta-1 [Geodia barretti]